MCAIETSLTDYAEKKRLEYLLAHHAEVRRLKALVVALDKALNKGTLQEPASAKER